MHFNCFFGSVKSHLPWGCDFQKQFWSFKVRHFRSLYATLHCLCVCLSDKKTKTNIVSLLQNLYLFIISRHDFLSSVQGPDLCESRGLEKLLRWASSIQAEGSQQQHAAVHFVPRLSITKKCFTCSSVLPDIQTWLFYWKKNQQNCITAMFACIIISP